MLQISYKSIGTCYKVSYKSIGGCYKSIGDVTNQLQINWWCYKSVTNQLVMLQNNYNGRICAINKQWCSLPIFMRNFQNVSFLYWCVGVFILHTHTHTHDTHTHSLSLSPLLSLSSLSLSLFSLSLFSSLSLSLAMSRVFVSDPEDWV